MDPNKVVEARKYRIYPTQVQEEQIIGTINACREIWNHLLSYVYKPVTELNEIQDAPDRERSRKMYDYIDGALIIEDNGKKQFFSSYKMLAKSLKLKEKDVEAAFENKNKVEFGKHIVHKSGLLYDEKKQLFKRLSRITVKNIRDEYERLKDFDADAEGIVQRNLKSAFDKHLMNPKHFGLPRFKSFKSTLYSGSYSTSASSKKKHMAYIQDNGTMKLAKVKREDSNVIMIDHYQAAKDARLYKVTFSRTSTNKYYVTLHYEQDKHTIQYTKTSKSIGIDMNVYSHGIALSNGIVLTPPDNSELEAKLRREKRKMSKRQGKALDMIRQLKQSAKEDPLVHVKDISEFGRYQKQRLKCARIQERIINRKDYWIDTVTSKLVEKYDFISIEDLKIKDMTAKVKGIGAGASKKYHKAMLDISPYAFREKLKYKLEWNNKQLVTVKPNYTSRVCSKCQRQNELFDKLSKDEWLQIRQWDCPYCGEHHDRDVNAAKNILLRGLNQNDKLD